MLSVQNRHMQPAQQPPHRRWSLASALGVIVTQRRVVCAAWTVVNHETFNIHTFDTHFVLTNTFFIRCFILKQTSSQRKLNTKTTTTKKNDIDGAQLTYMFVSPQRMSDAFNHDIKLNISFHAFLLVSIRFSVFIIRQ